MKNKLVAVILTGLMVASSFMGCGNKGQEGTQKASEQESQETQDRNQTETISEIEDDFAETISFSVSYIGADNTWKENDYYEMIAEKFNVDMQFISLSWDDWGEKQRIWVNSGDMPDVLFWDVNYNDYVEYADQGLIKALPDDFEQKYPNLANAVKKSGISDYLKEGSGGTLYAVPRTKNVDVESDEVVDFWCIYYRKDWAEQLGIEVGDVISFDEFLNLASEFVANDASGTGNTIGFSGDPDKTCKQFIESYNSYCNSFYQGEDGKYHAGIMDDATLDGVKALWKAYQDGLVDQDFFSNSTQDAENKFRAGQVGIVVGAVDPAQLTGQYTSFQSANPDLNAEECVGYAIVTGPDGKVHGYIDDNYWTAALFNPDMDEATMERILTMMDYFCTEEGIYSANLGIEGIDWKEENGEIIIIEQTDESGNVISASSKYPCTNYFKRMGVLPEGFAYKNPAYSKEMREACTEFLNTKVETGLNVKEADMYLKFFSGEEYSMYSVSYYEIATEVVLEAKSEAEVETLWNARMKEIEDKTDKVLDELNAGL